jgi:zinc transport system substrate-binding protein
MKKLAILFLILSLLATSGCSSDTNTGKMTIAVGIPPLAGFVENIAGENFDIVIMIPAGNSPANYQPSASQMQQLSDALTYFTLEMPPEEANILPKVTDFNNDINLVNLRNETAKKYPMIEAMDHHHGGEEEENHEDESFDPHIWLSPKRAMEIVRIIADELSSLDPENADFYSNNTEQYISLLMELDEKIKDSVGNMDNKSFMIYHGSYTYFADDYGLEMISLEASGKQATASEMQEVIEHAIEEGIKVVLYQDEFDDNQAKTVAEEIDGRVEKVSPLSRNYIDSLTNFIEILEGQDN